MFSSTSEKLEKSDKQGHVLVLSKDQRIYEKLNPCLNIGIGKKVSAKRSSPPNDQEKKRVTGKKTGQNKD